MSDSKQSANEELRHALRLCVEQMCARCREAADALTASIPCLTGCETLKIAKAALDRNPVEASNRMAMYGALLKVKRLFDGRIMFQQAIREAHEAVNAALAEPPRYCDVMSLEAARKLWFAKEIMPRLDGDLPLGKEVPFEEWFVSKIEQEVRYGKEAKETGV